jgi:alpha-tubulin suppressor-like RCC1 family protein
VLAGETHSCALAGDGTVSCWGNDAWGQAQAPADLLDSITDGAVLNSCGVVGSTAFCWGLDSAIPDDTFSLISGGAWRANCGVTGDGALRCWGVRDEPTLLEPPAGNEFRTVTLGFYFGCALDSDGAAHCWGSDAYGQVSNTSKTERYESIDAGYWNVCGVTIDGNLSCWGHSTGDVPTGTFAAVSVGIELVISAGGGHTCGLRANYTVECWGENTYGQSDSTPGF